MTHVSTVTGFGRWTRQPRQPEQTCCDLVQRHQVWKIIFVAAGLVVHPQIIADSNWVPDYFALVQDKADKICEMCLKQHHKNESEESEHYPSWMLHQLELRQPSSTVAKPDASSKKYMSSSSLENSVEAMLVLRPIKLFINDDAMKRRQSLLRSLLYDKGLPPLPMSLACNVFFRSGHGDPIEIVKELDADNWLKCCTSYNSPCIDVAYQVKLRLQPVGRNQICRPKRTPRHSEEDEEWNTLLALDKWLANRLYEGNYRSYKLDPEGPMKPPESVWPMLDKIDMGHTMQHRPSLTF
ncbi:hypothetical protein BGX24_002517 [Mortierella sp. AD032]|nr:hypothetical protein BGX24_002517 [Mortierella sp. AD032]